MPASAIRPRALAFSLALVLAVHSGAARAQDVPERNPRVQPPDVARTTTAPSPFSNDLSGWIGIGDRIPDFELDDARGGRVHLSRLRGQWVVLLFAGRREALHSLDSVAVALRGRNAVVIALCVDKAHTLSGIERRTPHQLTALADPTGEVTAQFGLWDAARRVASPGFVLVDPDGRARLALLGRSLQPGEILRLVEYGMSAASP